MLSGQIEGARCGATAATEAKLDALEISLHGRLDTASREHNNGFPVRRRGSDGAAEWSLSISRKERSGKAARASAEIVTVRG